MNAATGLFEKIASGQIPSWKIYEDEHTFAFLDIGPLSSGHTLVIPKRPYRTLDAVPDEVAASLGRTIKRVGAAVARATECAGWNVLQNNGAAAGQEVDHVHFHIIPRREGDGLGYRWNPKSLDEDDAKQLQSGIVASLDTPSA